MTDERKIELTQFIENAGTMSYEELDAMCGSFTDADGAFVRLFEKGRDALNEWIRMACVRDSLEREERRRINETSKQDYPRHLS